MHADVKTAVEAVIQALEKINSMDDIEFGEITPLEK